MKRDKQNEKTWIRILPMVLVALMLTLLWLGSSPARALAASAVAPKANGRALTGYDSPQFHAKQYAYVDTRKDVEELYIVAGDRWRVADLSAITGAPKANGRALTGYDSPQFHAKQYAYVDTNGHVEELYIVAGGGWHVADLSALTGAPTAAGGALTGYDSPQFHAKQYAYIDTNGHVEELYIVAGGGWHVADLSALTGAPSANGKALTGYDSPQFHAKQYAYLDISEHVEELYIVAGGGWNVADLSALTSAPGANGRVLTGYDSAQFHAKQYAYLASRHVEELYIVAGDRWRVADLSAITGAPGADGRTLTGYDSRQFHAKQYAYIDTNGDVEELYIVAGGGWHVADLSSISVS